MKYDWKSEDDLLNDWKDVLYNRVRHYAEEYEEDYDSEIVNKPRYDYEAMLRRVMKELRTTGADTFAVLKDEELGEWWTKEVKKIEHEEAVEAAKARASSSLSAKERKLLGLNF